MFGLTNCLFVGPTLTRPTMDTSESSNDIIFEEEDLPYEEEILRNPFSVKCWLRYIEHKKGAPNKVINLIYERSLKELPGSYKLWYNYLKLRRKQVMNICPTDPAFSEVNNAYERSLAFMHKMPRIWLDFCQFLVDQGLITRTRRTFDRALRALAITQHDRIWQLYLKFVKMYDLPEMAVRVYRRYLRVQPENSEEFIAYLISVNRLDEAATRLVGIINNDDFVSRKGKSKHQLWNELCDLISLNPKEVTSLKVEPIIRQGIKRYPEQAGSLWNSLADYYIISQHLEKARDMFEEAIQTVVTVRDFTQVFDKYSQFQESNLAAAMEANGDRPQGQDENLDLDYDLDLDLRMARIEDLLNRRPLLLNSVLLRQNPHNVNEWHKRVQLYEGKPRDIINTYTEAVQTVDPKLAMGKLQTLWVAFAKFYEVAGQIDDARIIFDKATLVEYKHVDDLANVWCEWTEMEIRHENYNDALKLLQKAVAPPAYSVNYHDQNETVQNRLHKSIKVWSMYADLEESFGTFKSCKAVYDKIIELKIVTPQIVINYGMYLEENNYFEEAFKAYEKGIALFKWPNVYDIWNTYLVKFIERYGGKKLERARDLFEQCLEGCPPVYAKPIYLMYAKLEEEHGLPRRALDKYDRATRVVLPEDRYEMFNVYIENAKKLYGVTHTRDIYQQAIEVLDEENARKMCLRFAELENKLGEIDRARAIYAHCSQMCDPRVTAEFWGAWKEFEVKHGNEDTMKEMLRVKRSVQALYNTQVNFMSAQMLSAQSIKQAAQEAAEDKDEMKKLEETARLLADEAAVDKPRAPGKGVMFVSAASNEDLVVEMTKTNNPQEILVDEEDNDDDETVEEVHLQKRTIPSEVFGGLVEEDD